MGYGPPVIKQCEYCKKDYSCPNSRADKSRFCSVTCRNKSDRQERFEYTCKSCGDKFMALPDHGQPRKFCSRKCFCADALPPKDKECENCGGMFTAIRSTTATRGDGWRIYCSAKCAHEHTRKFEERPCENCGAMFYPRSSKHDECQKVCSIECRAEFYSGVNAHNFQGGVHIQTQSNSKMILIGKREGYAGKYTAEHRLFIAKHIGRMLSRNEIVIHINNNNMDNRLSNLFVCDSMSEYKKRHNGSLPWPNKSNVDDYKEKSHG